MARGVLETSTGGKDVLKIITVQGNPNSRVQLYGQFTGEYVTEVEQVLTGQDTDGQKVTLDLTNITFVDRAAMLFLCGVKSGNVAVENVPSYVARWMEQEGLRGPPHSRASEQVTITNR